MGRKKLFAFAIEAELAKGLKQVQARDGISQSEQARRAIRAWLEDKGVKLPSPPRGDAPRPPRRRR